MLTIGCYTVAATVLLAVISRGLERLYRRRRRRWALLYAGARRRACALRGV